MNRRRLVSTLSAGLVILALLVSVTPAAAWGGNGHHGSKAVVRLDGLSSPKALGVGNWFDVYVGQGFAGPPAGPVLKYRTFWHGGTREVTGPETLTDLAVGRDGVRWYLGTDGVLTRQRHSGEPLQVVLDVPGLPGRRSGSLQPSCRRRPA